MDTSSKATARNRLAPVPDSDEDEFADDSPNARRIRLDEEVARSLQDELYREAEGFLSGDDPQEPPSIESDSDDFAVADPKGKGKAVPTRQASGSRAAAKKRVVQDSDDDEEDDDDYSDFVDLEPPTKKQKTAAKGRRKQASTKGKKSIPRASAFLSDSDDDLPCKQRPFSLPFPLTDFLATLLCSTYSLCPFSRIFDTTGRTGLY